MFTTLKNLMYSVSFLFFIELLRSNSGSYPYWANKDTEICIKEAIKPLSSSDWWARVLNHVFTKQSECWIDFIHEMKPQIANAVMCTHAQSMYILYNQKKLLGKN